MRNKCGDLNMHWWEPGQRDSCVCGQVPYDIFFGTACDCGEGRYLKPVHYKDCASIASQKKHNEWILAHPEVDPPMKPSKIRARDEAKSREANQ